MLSRTGFKINIGSADSRTSYGTSTTSSLHTTKKAQPTKARPSGEGIWCWAVGNYRLRTLTAFSIPTMVGAWCWVDGNSRLRTRSTLSSKPTGTKPTGEAKSSWKARKSGLLSGTALSAKPTGEGIWCSTKPTGEGIWCWVDGNYRLQPQTVFIVRTTRGGRWCWVDGNYRLRTQTALCAKPTGGGGWCWVDGNYRLQPQTALCARLISAGGAYWLGWEDLADRTITSNCIGTCTHTIP